MKELCIEDCQLIHGGMAARVFISNSAVRNGAIMGAGAYVAEQGMYGEDITLGGIVGYGLAGAAGAAVSIANLAIRATKHAELIGTAAAGGLIGVGNNLNDAMKSRDKSGSDYGH